LFKTPHVPLKLLFRSVAIGVVGAVASGALAFAAAPLFDAVGMYLTPARLFLPAMVRFIPSKLVYWLVPDGGAPAGVLLILVSAALFWAIIFGVTYFACAKLGRRRAAQRTTTANS
jgi:hypothetical protein